MNVEMQTYLSLAVIMDGDTFILIPTLRFSALTESTSLLLPEIATRRSVCNSAGSVSGIGFLAVPDFLSSAAPIT